MQTPRKFCFYFEQLLIINSFFQQFNDFLTKINLREINIRVSPNEKDTFVNVRL